MHPFNARAHIPDDCTSQIDELVVGNEVWVCVYIYSTRFAFTYGKRVDEYYFSRFTTERTLSKGLLNN